MKKKVLYFSPVNVLDGHAGNLTRMRRMLNYFVENSDQLDVDFVVTNSIQRGDDYTEFTDFKASFPTINFRKIYRRATKKNLITYLFDYKLPRLFAKNERLDLTTYYLRKQFQQLVEERQYDTIVINYANWGKLIQPGMKAHLIVDTHDLLTAQLRTNGEFAQGWGKVLEQECALLNRFDEIWTYSVEEQYLFEQFAGDSKVKLIPVTFEKKKLEVSKSYTFPILYVASENQHNIKSIHWYLDEVVPLLGDVTTYVVGSIGQQIGEHKNVVKLGRVDDLLETYAQSRVCICPMLSGTGVKIKVLESLSHGVPVVTTRRGLDGLVNKINNGCLLANTAEEFASQVKRLLSDEAFYSQHRVEAINLIQTYYSREAEQAIFNASFSINGLKAESI